MADQETIKILREIRESVLSKSGSPLPAESSLYQRAGIEDIREFYRTLFISGGILQPDYFSALNRFDISWARTMWVFNNVRPGSRLLDIGCGAGLLSVLRRKNVHLTGVDISEDCCSRSIANGYNAAVAAGLASLPFPDNAFDYVVSLDVFGHVEAKDKDAVIAEISRVLRPDGVTLHGIESLDPSKRKTYSDMTPAELQAYVSVDGHVGMEEPGEIEERFKKQFEFVDTRQRFAICQPAAEFIKQAGEYGQSICEPDFLRYVQSLDSGQRRAFDFAMGYVFDRISRYDLKLPQSEYLFLKASGQELGPFYNAYPARFTLASAQLQPSDGKSIGLDRHPNASFEHGWYPPEEFPPIARWMSNSGLVSFRSDRCSGLRLSLTTHMPDLHRNPLVIEFVLNGESIHVVTVIETGWFEVLLDTSQIHPNPEREFLFEIKADRTWVPNYYDRSNPDDRELSIAVCNLELLT